MPASVYQAQYGLLYTDANLDSYLQTMTFQILPIIFNKTIAIIAHFYVLFFGIFYLT